MESRISVATVLPEEAAAIVVQSLVEKPGCQAAILCKSHRWFHDSVMPLIWAQIPEEWKTGKAGEMSYSQRAGFTNDSFTLPNGSWCLFKSCHDGQDQSWQGSRHDVVWVCGTVSTGWQETAEHSVLTRNGRVIYSHT